MAAPAVMDLMSRQHLDPHLWGLKLSLYPAITEPLKLTTFPYCYAAATGNIALALHLYACGCTSTPLLVASVASAGVGGDTPWFKPVTASPTDIARLAGHPRMAQVLERMEARVPLVWEPRLHSAYPPGFRRQARSIMHAMCQSGWFLRLPGPARSCLTEQIMQQLAHMLVWDMVEPEEWVAARQGNFGSDVSAEVHKLLQTVLPSSALPGKGDELWGKRPVPPAQDLNVQEEEQAAFFGPLVPPAAPGQLHFRLSFAQHPRRGGWWWPLCWRAVRGALSVAAVCTCVQRCPSQRHQVVLLALAGAMAGVGLTVPGCTLLLAQLLLPG